MMQRQTAFIIPSAEGWKPLLDLIPEIEQVETFQELIEPSRIDENGHIRLPVYRTNKVVEQFHRLVYEIGIVLNFDWVSWDEGRKIVSDSDFDFDSIDILTKCKIITAVVRSERFRDGALAEAFQSGLILKLLKSIERQVLL
jgi:hypothetical protein